MKAVVVYESHWGNTAAIAQARSTIVQAEARVVESNNAFERAKPLRTAGPLRGKRRHDRAALYARSDLI